MTPTPDHDPRPRLSVSLDQDVYDAIRNLAHAQRDSAGGMINRLLAVQLGLIPREADRPKPDGGGY